MFLFLGLFLYNSIKSTIADKYEISETLGCNSTMLQVLEGKLKMELNTQQISYSAETKFSDFVFKISVWISVFWRKKRFKNPILCCRDIKQKPSLIFFGTPCTTTKSRGMRTFQSNI